MENNPKVLSNKDVLKKNNTNANEVLSSKQLSKQIEYGKQVSNRNQFLQDLQNRNAVDGFKEDVDANVNSALNVIEDIGLSGAKGFIGLGEGLVDFITGLTSGVVDLFGGDSSNIDEFTKRDLTNELLNNETAMRVLRAPDIIGYITNNWTKQDVEKNSLLSNAPEGTQQITRGVSEAVGQIWGQVLLAMATAGAGNAMAASSSAATSQIGTYIATHQQLASLTTLGASVAGKSIEESLNNDETIGRAILYGLVSGATEAGIEMLSGSAADKILGINSTLTGSLAKKINLDRVMQKVASNRSAQLAITLLGQMGGEAAEEMLGEILEPIEKKLIWANDQNVDSATLEDILVAGLIGGLSAGIFGGGNIAINHKAMISENILKDMDTARNDFINSNQTDEDFNNYQNKNNAYKEELEGIMGTMSDSQLKDFVGKMYNTEKGKGDFRFNNFDFENKKFDTFSFDTGTAIKTFKVNTTQDLTAEQQKDVEALKELYKRANTNSSGLSANIEIVDSLGQDADGNIINAYYDNSTNTIKIAVDAAKPIAALATHEFVHSFYNTPVVGQFISFLGEDNINRMKEQLKDLYKGASDEVLTEEAIAHLLESEVGNQEFLNRLYAEKPKLFKRIVNFFKKLFKGGFSEENKKHEQEYKTYAKMFETATKQENFKKISQVQSAFNNLKNGVSSSEEWKKDAVNATAEDVTYDRVENKKYSKSVDNNGNKLTIQQEEYFKDSKIRDDNGNLLVVYHTTNSEFNIFDKTKKGSNTNLADTNLGFFFASANDNKVQAQFGTLTKPYYLNITNPLDLSIYRNLSSDNYNDLSVEEKNVVDALANIFKPNNMALEDARQDIIDASFDFDFSADLKDELSNDSIIQKIKDNGFDGIIDFLSNSTDGSKKKIYEYIAFEPNQIKLTSNLDPTDNPDIRYSKELKKELDKEKQNSNISVTTAPYKTAPNNWGWNNKETKRVVKIINNRATKIIKSLNLALVNKTENTGGWAFTANDKGSEPSLSYNFDIKKSKKEDIELFSAIISNYGYETQDTSMLTRPLDPKDKNIKVVDAQYDDEAYEFEYFDGYKQAIQYKIILKENYNADEIIDILIDNGINFYTFNSNNELIINETVKINKDNGISLIEDFNNRINNVHSILVKKGITNDSLRTNETGLRFDDEGSRNEIIKKRLQVNKGRSNKSTNDSDYSNLDSEQLKQEVEKELGIDLTTEEIESPPLTKEEKKIVELKRKNKELKAEVREYIREFMKEIKLNERITEKDLELKLKNKQLEVTNKKLARELYKARKDYYNTWADYLDELIDNDLLVLDVKALQEINKRSNKLNRKIKNLKKIIKDKSYDTTYLRNGAEVDNILKVLAKFETGGWLSNPTKTKNAIKEFLGFYTPDNPVLGAYYDDTLAMELQDYVDGKFDRSKTGRIKNGIKVNGNQYVTLEQVVTLDKLFTMMTRFVKSQTELVLEGRRIKVQEYIISNNYNGQIAEQYKNRNTSDKHKVFRKIGRTYVEQVSKATNIAKIIDGTIDNEVGFVGGLINQTNEAAIRVAEIKNDLKQPLNDFYKANRKYMTDLIKGKLDFEIIDSNGNKHLVSKAQAMYFYMLNQRDQGKGHINVDFNKNAQGVKVYSESGTFKEQYQFNDASFADMESKFNDTDKAFMQVARTILDKGGEYKKATDKERYGYTNATEENYIPIVNDVYNRNVAVGRVSNGTIDNLFNLAFNMDTVKGAISAISNANLFQVLNKYIRQISNYAGAIITVENINKQLNYRDGGMSLVEQIESIYPGFRRWFDKLLADVFQVNMPSSMTRIMMELRSNYSRAALGLNIKVWTTQFTSYPLAFTELRASSLIYGLKGFAAYGRKRIGLVSEYEKYAPFTYNRTMENAILLAESNVEFVTESILNATTVPISHNDAVTIYMLWQACQKEIETRMGYKIGTEENKKEAGKLLDKVVQQTQPNYDRINAPTIKRSDSEVVKTLMMFKTQPFQMYNVIIDMVADFVNYKEREKWWKKNPDADKDPYGNTKEEFNKKYDNIKRKTVKKSSALFTATLSYALVAALFARLLGKKDDKDAVENITDEFISSTVSMFPVMSILYTKIGQGYSLSTSPIDYIFDTMEDLTALMKNPSKSRATNVIKDVSSMFGLPTKNLLDYTNGIIRVFDEGSAYKYKNIFYTSTYASDKKTFILAVDNNRENLANSTLENYLNKKGVSTNSNVIKSIYSLVKDNPDNLSKIASKALSKGDEIKLADDSIYTVTSADENKYKSSVSSNISSIVNLAKYRNLTDENKLKALKKTTDVTKAYTVLSSSATKAVSKNSLANAAYYFNFNIPSLVSYYYYISELKKDGSTKDKILSDINSSNFTPIQKIVLKDLVGYTLTDSEKSQVSSFAKNKGLSTTNLELLLKHL